MNGNLYYFYWKNMSQHINSRGTLPAWKKMQLAEEYPDLKRHSTQVYQKKGSLEETIADNSRVTPPSFLKTCEEMEDKDLIEKFSKDPIFMYRVKIIV